MSTKTVAKSDRIVSPSGKAGGVSLIPAESKDLSILERVCQRMTRAASRHETRALKAVVRALTHLANANDISIMEFLREYAVKREMPWQPEADSSYGLVHALAWAIGSSPNASHQRLEFPDLQRENTYESVPSVDELIEAAFALPKLHPLELRLFEETIRSSQHSEIDVLREALLLYSSNRDRGLVSLPF